MVSERRRSEVIAFLKHVKERRRLLEEEIKKEGELGGKKSPRILDANGKPVKATIPLVDGSGKPLKDEFANVHMNEDIDAVMKSRLGGEKGAMNSRVGAEKSMEEKGAEKGMKEKGAEKVTEKAAPMKSASEAMLNVYDAKEGDTIEICPEACMLVQEITQWLDETTGRDGGKR